MFLLSVYALQQLAERNYLPRITFTKWYLLSMQNYPLLQNLYIYLIGAYVSQMGQMTRCESKFRELKSLIRRKKDTNYKYDTA